MSLRYVNLSTRLFSTMKRGTQVHRPALTVLLYNDKQDKNVHRQITTKAATYSEKLGLFQFIKHNFKLQIQKSRLRAAGFYLYECVADRLDYADFMRVMRMPDTFNSWFLVTELHVWMVMCMLMSNPEYGRFVRNCVVEAMWKDVNTRAKKLGQEQPSIIRLQIKELSEEFQASLVNYDEGLLSGDTVLAGAIWRRLLHRDVACTAADLELLVKYIRHTMANLDNWNLDDFMMKKNLNWIPLHIEDKDTMQL